jgi:Protein of unknown function (DUF4446)
LADLNRMLSDNLALVVAILGILLVVLLAIVIFQSTRLGRAVRAYRSLVGDGAAGSLAEVLDGQVGRAEAIGRRLTELDAVQNDLVFRTAASLQHVGLVRFNPFEDTGSDQSFAIALLDGRRNGLVISSLHGRTGTRVFAKPVEGGTSSHALSDEEVRAIEIAVNDAAEGARR